MAFQKRCTDLPNKNHNDFLQSGVSAVNNTIGPKGLCQTISVFGFLFRPDRGSFPPDQLSRAKVIDAAMDAVYRFHTKPKLEFAKSHRGPFSEEQEDLSELKFGSTVLLCRKKSDQ